MRGWSVAARVFLVQVLAVLVIATALLVVLGLDARRAANDDAASTSLAVAVTIAADPTVVTAVESPNPSTELQPFALRVISAADVDYVTIMDPTGVRFTHPDEAQIGGRFLGTIDAALRGENLTETYTGTLGPSVRAVVPITSNGDVVGIVSAGVTTARVADDIVPRIPFVLSLAVVVALVGGAAAWLTRRSLGRLTGGLAPQQMQRMVRFYESVLRSVREGVVLTDANNRVVLYNDEAAELLGLSPAKGDVTATAADLGIDESVARLLESGRRVVEETHIAGSAVLLVNQERVEGSGAVMTLRDQSRLQRLVGELESVRTMSTALRSQSHEHANTLHTIVSLLELERYDEVRALVAENARTSQGLADAVVRAVEDPVLAAVLLGKSAQANERGIEFRFDVDHGIDLPLSPSETVSVVGNVVDNALEAAGSGATPRWVHVRLDADDEHVRLEVSDSGRGLPEADRDRVFELGVTTKPTDGGAHGIGLAVVARIVHAHGGGVAFTASSTVTALLPTGGDL